MPGQINIVVEDELSEAVLRRMLVQNRARLEVAVSLPIKKGWQSEGGKNGYGYIKKQLPTFNAAANKVPYVVLLDIDDRVCASAMIQDWLGGSIQNPNLLVRVAIREVESWLLADQQGMADFLHIRSNLITKTPEAIQDPKMEIVRLALSSRSKEIREALAPAVGTHSTIGPYFTRGLIGFVRDLWDPNAAARHSDSMRRALRAVSQFHPNPH